MMTSDGHMTCGRSHWRKSGRHPYRTHSSNPKGKRSPAESLGTLCRQHTKHCRLRPLPGGFPLIHGLIGRTRRTPPVLNTSDDWRDLFLLLVYSALETSHLKRKEKDTEQLVTLIKSERFKIKAINQRWWWLVCYTDGQEDQAHQMEAALAW